MEILTGKRETYWAAEEDPEVFGAEVQARFRHYWDVVRETRLYNRVLRNWRYYHNLFYTSGEDSEREIRRLGEDGNLAGLSVNHHRNLLQHLLTLATQNPPAYDVLAVNTDQRALKQSKLGEQLLNHYGYVEHTGNTYKDAVENALVMSAGYVKTTWDDRKGPPMPDPVTGGPMIDQARGTLLPSGDLDWSAPFWTDVAYNYRQKEWKKQRWVIVRELVNRWELAAKHPEQADKIIGYEPDTNHRPDFIATDFASTFWDKERPDEDDVPVFEFYHISTDALPGGRAVKVLGDIVLGDPNSPLPYQDLPVDRVVSGTFLGTAFGYTVGFDLQGLQEGMNGEMSTILTNHESFGVSPIWTPTGSSMSYEQLGKFLVHLQSDQEPKPIKLAETPAEIFQFVQVILSHMEYISGVNSVLRGQPEANLKSGRALALIAAQAVQFANPLIQSFNELLESNGTKTLRILRKFVNEPRVVALVGKQHKAWIREFSGEDLNLVDRVKVIAGNAMTRTLAGRVELADRLADRGYLRNREEYITVMSTGQLDALLEGEEAQLMVIREENERLLEGGPHRASVLDYHVLHIREHHATLNSTASREDPFLAEASLGSIMEHMQMLQDPMVQLFQTVLGYPTVIPAMPGLFGPPGPQASGPPQPAQPGEPGAPSVPKGPMGEREEVATEPAADAGDMP